MKKQNSELLNDSKIHIQADNFNDNVHKKDKNYKRNQSSVSSKDLNQVQKNITHANQKKVPK